jgi:hypothetical protein
VNKLPLSLIKTTRLLLFSNNKIHQLNKDSSCFKILNAMINCHTKFEPLTRCEKAKKKKE